MAWYYHHLQDELKLVQYTSLRNSFGVKKMNEILSTPARWMRGRNAAKKRSIDSVGVTLPKPAVAYMHGKRERGVIDIPELGMNE